MKPLALRVPSSALLIAAILVGCGGGGGGASPDAAMAGPDGAGPTTDGASNAADAPPTPATDGPAQSHDTGAPASDVSAAPDLAGGVNPLTVTGDHFCLAEKAESVRWIFGWEKHCQIAVADNPPLTPTQATMAANLCAYVVGGKMVESCSRTDVVAYCNAALAPPGTKAWKLVYKSALSPDAESVAVNSLSHCPGSMVYDPEGRAMPRVCKGTVSAKVDGVMVSFSKNLQCWYKSDGTKSLYSITGDSETNNNLKLFINGKGGSYGFETDPLGSASGGYLEGASNVFAFPADPAGRTLMVTKFADKGAGLTASFALGTLKNGRNETRTITEGTIEIQIAAP